MSKATTRADFISSSFTTYIWSAAWGLHLFRDIRSMAATSSHPSTGPSCTTIASCTLALPQPVARSPVAALGTGSTPTPGTRGCRAAAPGAGTETPWAPAPQAQAWPCRAPAASLLLLTSVLRSWHGGLASGTWESEITVCNCLSPYLHLPNLFKAP